MKILEWYNKRKLKKIYDKHNKENCLIYTSTEIRELFPDVINDISINVKSNYNNYKSNREFITMYLIATIVGRFNIRTSIEVVDYTNADRLYIIQFENGIDLIRFKLSV